MQRNPERVGSERETGVKRGRVMQEKVASRKQECEYRQNICVK